MNKYIIASLLLAALLTGCTSTGLTQRALQQPVPFALSQVLLRDAISDLNVDLRGHTRLEIEPRLSEVADLCITYIPMSKATAYVPLGVALDILCNQLIEKYKVNASWKTEGNKIVFFYAGSDAEYKLLKKRDTK